MSCYKVIVDGVEKDIHAASLHDALSEVAFRFRCHYGSIGRHYYENGEYRDYKFFDLIYYDHVVSNLEKDK